MKPLWHTVWQGRDIVVQRDGAEVDRFNAGPIERVLLLHRGSGDAPGDVVQAVVELPEHCLVFSADTGFAGRVNFERQSFWAEKACVHWVHIAKAPLPLRLRTGSGLLRLAPPPFARVPRSELAGHIGRWAVPGAQTWDERKRQRIERAQPFNLEHA